MAHPHFCDCDPCLNGPRYKRRRAADAERYRGALDRPAALVSKLERCFPILLALTALELATRRAG